MRYLSQHQSFQSVAALNEALYRHTCDHYFAMNETDHNVLKMLGRYAVKYVGVAHLKAATIAEAIGKSEKTVRRALSKLQGLGVIAKVKTLRKVSGGYGANLYVIQPPMPITDQSQVSSRQEAEEPVTTPSEPAKKEAEACTSSSAKELSNDKTYADADVAASPYRQFKRMAENFVADRKLTNRLYGIYLAQSSYLKTAFDPSDLLNAAIEALKVTFQATKRKRIRNVCGFYTGVIDKLYDRLYFAETHAF
ncbi:helix-turn-helix domain-containing protein [Rossellomorea marisflavi]|uniref:helix-turn-helix domain-containing protein n=1 Tax=Rossellomorea marisflavi TaxID=189381 RepID=UPI0013182F22|nr:helix-turn-helix domain-containing protein [Rossellomorea marisflavi]QHA36885.1 helix-turn-helix domain-containing protein [Rossellomorea marisflavi]